MSDQQTTLPLHPSLAALNLPPLPWVMDLEYAGIYTADDFEVAYVPKNRDCRTKPNVYRQYSEEDRLAVTRVLTIGPELLNWMLKYRDWQNDQAFGRDDYNQWVALRHDLDTIVARALGQEGGSHE